MRAHPSLNGILFGTAEGSLKPRRHRIAGGGDLYPLKSVIHDWDDERVVTILLHCRQVIPDHGRLLITEPVIPTVGPSVHALIYLSDLVNVGGRNTPRQIPAHRCPACRANRQTCRSDLSVRSRSANDTSCSAGWSPAPVARPSWAVPWATEHGELCARECPVNGSIALSVVAEGEAHPRRMRCRRSRKPARPYICLLISLVLVLTPSVPPLWYSLVRAARTAS